VRGYLVLARISGSHKTASRSAPSADDNFLRSDGGCEGRIRLFYKNVGAKKAHDWRGRCPATQGWMLPIHSAILMNSLKGERALRIWWS
jgi:hypothetical protein